MTISSTVRRVGPFVGNGVATTFAFTFKIFERSDIEATLLVISTGVETTLTLDTDYTVAMNADQENNPGGVVTYPVSGSALASTHTLTITSDVPQTQVADIPNAGGWYPEIVERALDRCTILVQQMQEVLSRAFTLPVSSGASAELPSPVAGTAFGWNAGGTAIVNYVLQAGTSLVDILATLATSSGAALVGFIQSGVGAAARTLESKMFEYPSVTDYDAVGDGTTNDTAAFTAAQTAHEFIYVPEGLTCLVNAGLNYWQFFGPGAVIEPGVTWDLSPTPQTDYGVLKAIKRYTWGSYEHAVGATINVGEERTPLQTRENTQVMGTTGAGFRAITERGSVALNLTNYGFAQSELTATTYTANTVQDAAIAALITAGKLKRGMLIDVALAADRLSSTHTGTIQSWSGTTITVDAWYTTSGGAVSTPANATACTINPVNKVWGVNLNIYPGNDQVAGAGFELGILSGNATQAGKIWGMDVVGLSSTYKVQADFIARGYSTHGFIVGTTWGENDYGFTSENPLQVGHLVRRISGQTSTGDSFAVETGKTLASATGLYTTGGVRRWTVDKDGLVNHDYQTTKLDTDTTAVSVGHVIQTEVHTIINVTANRAFVLPTAVGIGSRKYTLIAYQPCTIAAPGAETLDGAAAAFSVGARGEIKVASDGANWIVESVSGYAQFTTPTFAAGDFTGSGAMTVTVASAETYEYKIVGKHMWVNFSFSAVMAGVAGAYILVKIPLGKTASSAVAGHMWSNQNGTFAIGQCIVNNGVVGANIAMTLVNAANWTVGGITTSIQGQINFPIN